MPPRARLALLLCGLLHGPACVPAAPVSAAPPSPPAVAAPPAIVQIGAPVLRARAAEVAPERIASDELQDLIRSMITAMREAPGVGLAAPQLGVPLRVLVLEDRPELMARLSPDELRERERAELPLRVFINPVLRPIGEQTRLFFEGCLSVQGYTALVERSHEVEVTGLDERGQLHAMRVHGWPARILQHEVDHLDGTIYVDRMIPRSFVTSEHARARFAGKPIAEIQRLLGL